MQPIEEPRYAALLQIEPTDTPAPGYLMAIAVYTADLLGLRDSLPADPAQDTAAEAAMRRILAAYP